MTKVSSPLHDEIHRLIALMSGPNTKAVETAASRNEQLTKPPGSLGRLEEIALWLAAWQSGPEPQILSPLVCVFAANHGVASRGVSAYPTEVTHQMVANFRNGGAAINQICKSFDLRLKIIELAIEHPTQDFTLAPAMEEDECLSAFARGREAVQHGTDLLCLGEMGIGNTTSAAAIYAALYGEDAAHWAGRGTGLDDAGLARKQAAIKAGLALHNDHLSDPIEVLRRLGGREIAALSGAILEARLQRIPVVLDGYIVTAAAAILHRLNPYAIDHCIAGHVSPEGAHSEALIRLAKRPLLDLTMRLGEASGAALAAGTIKAALACYQGMATFAQAGVADKSAADKKA
jgi:nicotinate-nucleotide--dimethylbenzimidazole phosphoribosyltransferase